MLALLYKSVLEDVSGGLRRLGLVPGCTVAIEPGCDAGSVAVFIRPPRRLFGLWSPRPVRLGMLNKTHAAAIYPLLESGIRIRGRVVDILGPPNAPTGAAISIWLLESIRLTPTQSAGVHSQAPAE